MIGIMALVMIAFYGLAVCTIGGMVTSGISSSFAMATAVFEIIVGVVIAKAIYSRA